MFNPDYPTDNGGSFLMHTYQQPQQNTMFWNGQSFGMMGGMSYMNDTNSRRNFNPVNPFNAYGQVQPNMMPNATNPFANNTNGSIPENMVQPFGTYPPATPNGQPMGLNALVDSRRNMNNPVQVSQNNPWATPTQNQPAQMPAPQAPQQSMLSPFFGQNPYDPYGMGCGFKVDMNTAALYNPSSVPSFDRSNSWDNCYTKYRPLMSPSNIDWRGQYQQQNPFTLQAPQPQMPQYPVQQYAVPQNWNDVAERNWASANY